MKRSVFFSVVLILSLFVTVSAQEPIPAVYVDVTEVDGLGPDGYILFDGADLAIKVRFINDEVARTLIWNGFYFDSPDITIESIEVEWSPEYPWDPIYALMMGCFPPPMGGCYPYFDTITQDPIDKGLGGFGMTGFAHPAGTSTGMPASFDDRAYTFTLIGVTGPPGAVLTMDTTAWVVGTQTYIWNWNGDFNISWGGPYQFEFAPAPPDPYTTCWPQPVELGSNDNDRILNVSIFNEENDLVDLTSVRVYGEIPSYTNDGVAWIDGDSIVTDAFLMRFLGSGSFRPLDPNGIVSTYFVTYTKAGFEYSLTGDFVMNFNRGDVTFDGSVGIDDVVFMMENLFGDGPGCELDGYPMDECMDVDHSGRFDLLDVRELIEMIY